MSQPLLPSLQVTLLNDTGISAIDRLSKDVRLKINGLVQGAKVQYSVDGATWSLTQPSAVQGLNSVWLRQIDNVGNVSEAISFEFSFDNKISAPIVSLLNDTGSSVSDKLTKDATLNVTGIEAGALVEYSSNGSVWSSSAPVAKQGTNLVYVRQTDIAGNVASSVFQFSFDDVAAEASLQIKLLNDTGIAGDLVSKDGTVAVSNISQGHRLEYSANGVDWSNSKPLSKEGANTFWVRQVDSAGNASTAQKLDFILDTKAATPIVVLANDTGVLSSDRLTNNANLTVTGVESGATVEYSQDNKTWSSSAPTAMNGLNIVYVRQTDAVGNISGINKFSFMFDGQAGLAPTIRLVKDTGVSASDNITSDGRWTVSGLETGSTVEYSSNGSTWGSTLPTAVLGQNSVYVRQIDKAGNISPVSVLEFTLVTPEVTPPPPPPPVVIPEANLQPILRKDSGIDGDKITNDGTLIINNVGAGNRVEYSLDNGNTWTSSKPVAVEGENTIWLRQVNSQGNASTKQSITFVYDNKAPTSPIISLLNDTGISARDNVSQDGRITVSGIEAGAQVQYSQNGQTWSSSVPTAVEGVNMVWVRQVDVAGNSSPASVLRFTVDNQAPTASLQLALRNDTGVVGDLITREGVVTVSSIGAGNRIEYSSNGTTWTTSQPVAKEGNNSLWVRQVDVAGNGSEAQRLDFVVKTKTANPTVSLANDTGISSLDRLTNDNSLKVVTAEVGATVQYSQDGITWGTTVPMAVEGLNVVSVRTIDVAGNISAVQRISYVYDSKINPLQVNLAADTGISNTDQITRSSLVMVRGLETGGKWQYQLDGGAWQTGVGSSFHLTAGSHSYLIRHTDKAGNVAETTLNATLDTSVSTLQVQLTDDTGVSNSDNISQLVGLAVNNVEDGALIEYSTNGTTWSSTAPTAQEGSNTVWVRQTDKAGNISASQQIQFINDTQIQTPTLSIEDTGASDSDGITRISTVTVSGLEFGAVWEYQIDGGVWQEGTGTTFNLVDGVHSYVVRQTDTAGNVATSSFLNADYLANPSTILVQMLDSQGNMITNGFSNDPNAVLRLSGEDTDTWQYRYVDPVNGHGQWQDVTGSQQDIMLTEGAYNIETRKIDIAGNFVSALNRVKIDTTAATPTMTFVEDTGMVGDGISTNALVDIGGLEGQAIWEVRVDDSPYWNTTTVASNQFKLLVGTHTYYIRQTDKAGNISEIGEYTFTYQSAVVEPTLSLDEDTGVSNLDLVSNQSQINVNGLLADAIWQYQTDQNGQWLEGSGTSFQMLTDGQSHHYSVRQQSGGIWSEATTLYAVRFDNTAPTDFGVNLQVDSGSFSNDGITNQSNVLLTGLEVGARFEYRVDGGEWQGFEVNSTSATLNLEVGTHDYEFRQQDTAGNFANVITRTYTYINADLAAPSMVLNNDTGDLSTDRITNAGQINVTLSVSGTGVRWQYQVDNGLWLDGSGSSFMAQAGTHSYRVRQLDVAGNVSPASDALSINFDSIAPTFSSASSVKVTDADSERVQLISNSQVLYTASANDSSGISSYSMADNDIFNFDPLSRQLTFKQPIGYRVDSNNVYTAVLTATDMAGNSTEKTVNVEVMRTNTSAPTIELGELKTGLQLNSSGARSGLSAFADNTLAIGASIYNATTQTWLNIPVRYNTQGVELNRFTPPSNVREVYGVGVDDSDRLYMVVGVGKPVTNNQTSPSYATTLKVLRFTKEGVLDTSYGTSGEVVISPSQAGQIMAMTNSSYAHDRLHVTADGRVAITLTQVPDTASVAFADTNSAVLEISNTGTIASRANLNFSSSAGTYEQMMGVDVGRAGQIYVLRIDNKIQKVSNGVLDTAFGSSGVLDPGSAFYGYTTIKADDNGKLYVLTVNGTQTITLRRYNENGTLDTAFGSSGSLTITGSANVSDASMDFNASAGKIYIVSATTNTDYVYEVSTAGIRNTSFGGSGAIAMSATGRISNGTKLAGEVNSVIYKNNKLYIYAEGDGTNSGGSTRVVDLAKQAPDESFGQVLLTMNEGNRPIGLLNPRSFISDFDLADKSYNGLTVNVKRQSSQSSDDIFAARGDLQLTDQGRMLWQGQDIGGYTNVFGSLTMTFNANTTQTILNDVLRSLTYRNGSQSADGAIKLVWTVNDNDTAGAKSTQAIQTINIRNDFADVGDSILRAKINNTSIDFTGFFQANGKTYYSASNINRATLDNFFNFGEDTTDTARTAVLENGVQLKLLTQAELTALWNSGQAPFYARQTTLESGYGSLGWVVPVADYGGSANTHYAYNLQTKSFTIVNDSTGPTTVSPFFEVINTTTPAPAYVEPALKLLVDNGDLNNDRLTSDGRFQVIGLNTSLPFELSIDGGNTWTNQVAGSLTVEVAEGTYDVGMIRVRQTDLSGFVDTILSNSNYKIDKSIKSLGLLNDQGLSITDNISADGRIVINGLDLALPYEYSLDYGGSWQTGSLLANGMPGFILADGNYAASQIRIRQTDVNGFTSGARNTTAIQIDPLVGQGSVILVRDTGESSTDFVTADDRVNVIGLVANKATEYSINGGQSWTAMADSTITTKTFSIAEGSYAINQVLVRQTDDTGYTTVVANRNAFLIDKTTKAVELFNDQGVMTFDNVTADGRIIVKGFNNALSYQYSTDSGTTWNTGTKVGNNLIFNVADGVYVANKLQVRQTDANNLTTIAKNINTLTISQTNGQGKINMDYDSGSSNTDNITNYNRFTITGLRDLDWEYSLNNGSTWQAGTRSGYSYAQNLLLPSNSYAVNQLQIRQTDSNGYTTVIKNSSVYVVDTTIQTATISLVNDSGYSNTDFLTADGRIRIDMSSSLNAGDTWTYSVDSGVTWQAGTGSSQTITLANGTYGYYAIRVKVTDLAGNASTAAYDKRVIIDNTDTAAPIFTNPSSVIVVDNDGTESWLKIGKYTRLLTVETTDANKVYYSLSGASASLFNIDSYGDIRFNENTGLSNASGDNYNLTVNAVDAFGNSSSQNVTVQVQDILRVTHKSVGSKYDVIESSNDLVITFNQNIAFEPNGTLAIHEPSSGARILNINDPSQVSIVGNQLIIQTDGLNKQGTYTISSNNAIKSLETGRTWYSSEYGDVGFSLNNQVKYDNGQLSPKDSFEVLAIDGSDHKGGVAILGDVNGDGIDDWAVSYATADSLGRHDNGKVYVVYGRTDGVAPSLANVANGQGGYLISGRSSGDLAGSSIAAAGDVNGDGLQDLLIHAKGAKGENDGLGRGYVVYGSKVATNLDLTNLENNSFYGRVYTNNVTDSFGAVGDVNGDGYDDIGHGRGDLKRVTSWDEVKTSTSVFTREGKIIVQADWLSFAADWIDAASTVAAFFDDPLAASIELMADLPEKVELVMGADGDLSEIEEAMLGQFQQVVRELQPNQRLIDFSYTQSGGGGGGLFQKPSDTIYTLTFKIESLNKTVTTWTLTLNGAGEANIELGGANGYSGTRKIVANINGEQLGAQVTALGDINGDGRADYGVLDTGSGGVMARLNVVLGSSARGDIFTSNLDSRLEGFRIIDPTQSTEYVGAGNVTGLGDLNGDGYSDFAITTDSAKTATYVVYGRAGMNDVNLAQVAAGNGGFVLSTAWNNSNVHVDAIGDFNGDGLDDLVFYSSGYGKTGTLSVIYGSSNSSGNYYQEAFKDGTKGFRIETGWSDNFADVDAVSAGDINGDGLSDLLIRSKNGDALFVMGSTDNGKFSQVRADQVGTTGSDTIVSTGTQQIVTGLGNDTVTTNGADVVLMGSGNDRAIINSSTISALYSGLGNGGNNGQLARLDGGAGFDTLSLSGGASLDFSRISNKALDLDGIRERVDGFEKIDLATDTGANSLRLNLADVLDIADSNIANTNNGWTNISGSSLSSLVAKHQLVIAGTNADTLTIRGSEWSNTGTTVRDSSGELYNVYNGQNAAAQLLIDKDMIIAMI